MPLPSGRITEYHKPTKREYIPHKSEFNMTILDFERIDAIMKRMDFYAIQCGEIKISQNLLPYLTALKGLYRYMRPLMTPTNQMFYDQTFRKFRKAILVDKRLDFDIFEQMEELHDQLLTSRQILGMGLFARKDVKIAERYLKPEYGGPQKGEGLDEQAT